MATSSITDSFCCTDAKAANALARLMFGRKVPSAWTRTPDLSDVSTREGMDRAQVRDFWLGVARRGDHLNGGE